VSVEKISGQRRWVFSCDECPEFFDTADLDDDVEHVGDASAHARAAGWVAFQTGKKMMDGSPEWAHMCPECAED
jgi:hypothetical protein